MPFVMSVFKGYYRLLSLLFQNFLCCMQIGFELLNNPTPNPSNSAIHHLVYGDREHCVLAFRINQCEQRNEHHI